MRPLAGPRSLIGPTSVLYGSLPKLLWRKSAMSCGPGVSAAMASCTASLTAALFMPTSSGFLCCQSKRSGKYADCAIAARDVLDVVDVVDVVARGTTWRWATMGLEKATRAAMATMATGVTGVTARTANAARFFMTFTLSQGTSDASRRLTCNDRHHSGGPSARSRAAGGRGRRRAVSVG